jgi:hypothetical protein
MKNEQKYTSSNQEWCNYIHAAAIISLNTSVLHQEWYVIMCHVSLMPHSSKKISIFKDKTAFPIFLIQEQLLLVAAGLSKLRSDVK